VDKTRSSKVKDTLKAKLTFLVTKKDICGLVKYKLDKEESDKGKED